MSDENGDIADPLIAYKKYQNFSFGGFDVDAYEYYLQGRMLFEKGEYLSAVVYLNKSNEIDPHFKTYERLYSCYCCLNDMYNAFNAISLSYDLNDRNDKTAVEYAEMLISYKKDYSAAKEILEKILQRNPTYKKAKIILNEIK